MLKDENTSSGNKENSTCPPIETGIHQNDNKPQNIETRGVNKNR